MDRNAPEPANPGSASVPVPPRHPREEERVASVTALLRGCVLPDPLMEAYARRAAEICQAPIGMATLIGEREQRLLACVGTEGEGPGGDRADRDSAFCAHTILESGPTVVEDARLDARFRNNPHVASDPGIRFYTGAPLLDGEGLPLGSLCAIDFEPRAISSKRLLALQGLARSASVALEARRVLREFVPEDRLVDAGARLDAVFERFSAR